jgi:hypothetical protein
MNSRRDFTIVPVVLFLALVAVGLSIALAIKGVPQPATANAAYNAGKAAGSWAGPLVVALLMIPVASKLAERRSVGFATVVVGSILLLVNLASGIAVLRSFGVIPQRIAGSGTMAQSQASSATNTRGAVPADQGVSPQGSSPAPRAGGQVNTNAVDKLAEETRARADAMQRKVEEDRKQREEQRAKEAEAEDRAKAKLDEISDARLAALNTRAAAIAEKVKAFCTIAAKPPAPSKKAVDDRRAEATKLAQELKTFNESLNRESDDLKAAMLEAGASEFDANFRASQAISTWTLRIREFAVDRFVQACTYVQEECDVLSKHMGKWTVKNGEVTAKDPMIAADCRAPRVHLGGILTMQDTWLKQIEGK